MTETCVSIMCYSSKWVLHECGHCMEVKGQKINGNHLIRLDTGHHFPQGNVVGVESLCPLSYLEEEKDQPGWERDIGSGNCTWVPIKGCRSLYFISARMG